MDTFFYISYYYLFELDFYILDKINIKKVSNNTQYKLNILNKLNN
jgi:hypothetical protein